MDTFADGFSGSAVILDASLEREFEQRLADSPARSSRASSVPPRASKYFARCAPAGAADGVRAGAHRSESRAHISSGSAKNAARQVALPEVLVPPGEWQAAMQFVATLQRDQKRAAVLAKSLERSSKPLETSGPEDPLARDYRARGAGRFASGRR